MADDFTSVPEALALATGRVKPPTPPATHRTRVQPRRYV